MSSVMSRDGSAVARAVAPARPALALRSGAVASTARPPRRPTTAADVMTRFPLTVQQGDSMWTAWDRLSGGTDSHLVVVDHHRRPLGVLDDRTIAVEWPAGPVAAQRTPVHTLLRGRTRPRVRSSDDLATVARVMVGAHADALPVVDREGRLYGLVTLWHFAQLAARGESRVGR
jgi:CBS domain-containing protein